MDVSFDAFGGGNGWGEQGEQEFNSISNTQRLNMFEKIPIPVSINELIKMPENEEKYRISSYTFNTIKVVGSIVSVQSDQDETCITYEICDPFNGDLKMNPHFTVIRYQGVDSFPRASAFKEGTIVKAIGKLRSFNNRLSLISFHIHEIDNSEEVEIFRIEAKLANIYYNKNLSERSADQLNSYGQQLLSCSVSTRDMKSGQASQQNRNGQFTVPDPNVRKLYHESAPGNNRGLGGQQAKIYNYIKQNGASDCGVSSDEIRSAIRPDGKFLSDINYLLGEGIIYNTLDEEHFAVIE